MVDSHEEAIAKLRSARRINWFDVLRQTLENTKSGKQLTIGDLRSAARAVQKRVKRELPTLESEEEPPSTTIGGSWTGPTK